LLAQLACHWVAYRGAVAWVGIEGWLGGICVRGEDSLIKFLFDEELGALGEPYEEEQLEFISTAYN
jgi:hypothetical protein